MKNERPSEKEYLAGEARREPTSGQSVQKWLRATMARSCGERVNAGTRRRNGAGSLFGENGKGKWREHMRENPYKQLPPIERKPDGSLYRMTPTQRKQANALIRLEHIFLMR